MHGNSMKEYVVANKKKVMKTLVIVLIAAVAVFVFFFQTGSKETIPLTKEATATEEQGNANSEVSEAAVNDASTIIVDVGGQVMSPQVVELARDARISDAIEAAGGLTKKADISGINRAQVLKDGEKVYVPAKGEQPVQQAGQGDSTGATESASSDAAGAVSSDGKININTADATKLQEITGVGPATAQKIIDYRSKTPFGSIEDLKKVSGIGEKTFEKMRDQVTI